MQTTIPLETITALSFTASSLLQDLNEASPEALDGLDFGVIGFDGDGHVRVYNSFESQAAGLSRERVLGYPLFTMVAPCMNNYLVAQRFEDANDDAEALDDVIDYVLTLRMRPIKVRLRLLADPDSTLRYVLVQRVI